jgi:hypothetical protein
MTSTTRRRRASATESRSKGSRRPGAKPAPAADSAVEYDDALPGSLFLESDASAPGEAEGAVDDAVALDPERDVVDEPAETRRRRR